MQNHLRKALRQLHEALVASERHTPAGRSFDATPELRRLERRLALNADFSVSGQTLTLNNFTDTPADSLTVDTSGGNIRLTLDSGVWNGTDINNTGGTDKLISGNGTPTLTLFTDPSAANTADLAELNALLDSIVIDGGASTGPQLNVSFQDADFSPIVTTLTIDDVASVNQTAGTLKVNALSVEATGDITNLNLANATKVTAKSTVKGDIALSGLGSLELDQVSTNDGDITITAGGALTDAAGSTVVSSGKTTLVARSLGASAPSALNPLNVSTTNLSLTVTNGFNVSNSRVLTDLSITVDPSGGAYTYQLNSGGVTAFRVTDSGANTTVTDVDTAANFSLTTVTGDMLVGSVISGGDITLESQTGSILVNGPGGVTGNGDTELVAKTAIALSESVASTRVGLMAGTTITQTPNGVVSAEELAINAGGTVSLSEANEVGVLAAKVANGDFTFRTIGPLNVGSVKVGDMAIIDGVTVTAQAAPRFAKLQGDGGLQLDRAVSADHVALVTTGPSATITQNALGLITAKELLVMATGNVTLSQANLVDVLAAGVTGGNIEFRSASTLALAIDSVTVPGMASVTGVTVTPGRFAKLTSDAALVLKQEVRAADGKVALMAGATISQEVLGLITAKELLVIAAGKVTLDKNNAVDEIAAAVTEGSLDFKTTEALTVGDVDVNGMRRAGIVITNNDPSKGYTLTLSANNGIKQADADPTTGNPTASIDVDVTTATFQVGAGQSILLSDVELNDPANYAKTKNRFYNDATKTETELKFSTAGGIQNLTIVDQTAVILKDINIEGDLSVVAGSTGIATDAITDANAVVVGGKARFHAIGDGRTIDLGQLGIAGTDKDNIGNLAVSTQKGDAKLVNATAIAFRNDVATNVQGNLSVTATTQDITDAKVVNDPDPMKDRSSQIVVSSDASFTALAGGIVLADTFKKGSGAPLDPDLGDVLSVGGKATFFSASGDDIQVGLDTTAADRMTDSGATVNLRSVRLESRDGGDTTRGDVSIFEDSDLEFFGEKRAQSLVATASGSISDLPATTIDIGDFATFKATAGSIALADTAGKLEVINKAEFISTSGGEIRVGVVPAVATTPMDRLTERMTGSGATVILGSVRLESRNNGDTTRGDVSIFEDSDLEFFGENRAQSLVATAQGQITDADVLNDSDPMKDRSSQILVNDDALFTALDGGIVLADTFMMGSGAPLDPDLGDVLSVGGKAEFISTSGSEIRVGVKAGDRMADSEATVNLGMVRFDSLNTVAGTRGYVTIFEDSDLEFFGETRAQSLVATARGRMTDQDNTQINVAGDATFKALGRAAMVADPAVPGEIVLADFNDGGEPTAKFDVLRVGGKAEFTSTSGDVIRVGVKAGDRVGDSEATVNLGMVRFDSLNTVAGTRGDVSIFEDSDLELFGENRAQSLVATARGRMTDKDNTQINVAGDATFKALGRAAIGADPAVPGEIVLADFNDGGVPTAKFDVLSVGGKAEFISISGDVIRVGVKAGDRMADSAATVILGSVSFDSSKSENATVSGDVSIFEDSDLVFTGMNFGRSLVATATGPISDLPSTTIDISDFATFKATAGSIVLADMAGKLEVTNKTEFISTSGGEIRVGVVPPGTSVPTDLSKDRMTGSAATVILGSVSLDSSKSDDATVRGDVSIFEDSDLVFTGMNFGRSLVASATGSISDLPATKIDIGDFATFKATTGSITLANESADTLSVVGLATFVSTGVQGRIEVGVEPVNSMNLLPGADSGASVNLGRLAFSTDGTDGHVTVNNDQATQIASQMSGALSRTGTLTLVSRGSITDDVSTKLRVDGLTTLYVTLYNSDIILGVGSAQLDLGRLTIPKADTLVGADDVRGTHPNNRLVKNVSIEEKSDDASATTANIVLMDVAVQETLFVANQNDAGSILQDLPTESSTGVGPQVTATLVTAKFAGFTTTDGGVILRKTSFDAIASDTNGGYDIKGTGVADLSKIVTDLNDSRLELNSNGVPDNQGLQPVTVKDGKIVPWAQSTVYGLVIANEASDLTIGKGVTNPAASGSRLSGVKAVQGNSYVATQANLVFKPDVPNTMVVDTTGEYSFEAGIGVFTAVAGGTLSIEDGAILQSTQNKASGPEFGKVLNVGDKDPSFDERTGGGERRLGPKLVVKAETPTITPGVSGTTRDLPTSEGYVQQIEMEVGDTGEQGFLLDILWADTISQEIGELDPIPPDNEVPLAKNAERVLVRNGTAAEQRLIARRDYNEPDDLINLAFNANGLNLPTEIRVFNAPPINLFQDGGERDLNVTTTVVSSLTGNYVSAFLSTIPQVIPLDQTPPAPQLAIPSIVARPQPQLTPSSPERVEDARYATPERDDRRIFYGRLDKESDSKQIDPDDRKEYEAEDETNKVIVDKIAETIKEAAEYVSGEYGVEAEDEMGEKKLIATIYKEFSEALGEMQIEVEYEEGAAGEGDDSLDESDRASEGPDEGDSGSLPPSRPFERWSDWDRSEAAEDRSAPLGAGLIASGLLVMRQKKTPTRPTQRWFRKPR